MLAGLRKMQSVASLPLKCGRQRIREEDIEWSLCILCQKSKLSPKDAAISIATPSGIERVLDSAREREKFNDVTFIDVLDRLTQVSLKENEHRVTWHRICYSNFTNKTELQRLQKRHSNNIASSASGDLTENYEINEAQSSRQSRRSIECIDWSKCIYCQEDLPRLSLSQVQTLHTSDKILSTA